MKTSMPLLRMACDSSPCLHHKPVLRSDLQWNYDTLPWICLDRWTGIRTA